VHADRSDRVVAAGDEQAVRELIAAHIRAVESSGAPA
jgi:hypothetical protein